MTDASSSNWGAPWMDAQRKYWESWLELTRQGLGAQAAETPPPLNPWRQSLEQWTRMLASAVPPQSREWVHKFADINGAYLSLGENLMKGLSMGQTAQPANWNWMLDSLKHMQGATPPFGQAQDPWAGFATFWGMPMDNWRRVYSACSIAPGDFEKALRGFGSLAGGESPENLMGRLFSTPTLGYTREWQEEVQTWGQLWLEHVEALREYGLLLANSNMKAAESLGAKLRKLGEEGKTPDSFRAFYDLWVDAGEDAYAEIAISQPFAKAQARLTNTLMAVKRQEQQMVDEVLSALNMPTRRELDTSHRRLHELQRQVWRLQEALDDAGILELREEVMSLRRELQALRGGESAAGAEKRGPARKAKSDAET
jgi:class III poly(R)-hydroxyalkanoic acid synthase PhaE subunit